MNTNMHDGQLEYLRRLRRGTTYIAVLCAACALLDVFVLHAWWWLAPMQGFVGLVAVGIVLITTSGIRRERRRQWR
jgi:hypothetical protein